MELLEDAELRTEADELRERARNGESLDDLLPEAFALTPRGGAADDRPAPLRRPADRRHGAAQRRDRRDEDRRGQDADRDARRLPQHARGRRRPPRHRQRLPGPPRRRVDGADLRRARASPSARSRSPTTPADRKAIYAQDVTYGTNSEFGFDYLRDNMASSLENCVQRGHEFAIVDEVDNILIDEARTPLIISGRPEQAADTYYTFARLAKQLKGEESKPKLKSLGESKDTSEAEHDYEYDEKHKTVAPTEGGVHRAEQFLGVENLYVSEHGTLVNHLIQSLKAESLYKRDKDYAVIDGEVKIIDEFTGRILEGRRWSEGLHQAIEAKEGVAIKAENQTLATITLQNYFRLYDKLSGMTGTALTEATGVHEDLRDAGGRDPDQPADGPRRPQRPDLQDQAGQVEGRRQRDQGAQRGGPADPRRHGLGRDLGDALRAAQAQRHRARRPQRQARARPARGRDDRPGGPDRRGHDRDQHGRPRRRHQARRRPRAAWPGSSSRKLGAEARERELRRGAARR